MEQKDDFKLELQQELRDLQQEIAQRSSFNTEAWRKIVKQHSNELYLGDAVFAVGCVSFIIVSIILSVCFKWEWWLVFIINLDISWILMDYLFSRNVLRNADVQSRKGLLSLRESINSYSKRRRTIIRIIGVTLFVVIGIVLLFYDRLVFFIWLLLGLFDFLFWFIDGKQRTKSYEELNKEINELLKEE